MISVAILFFLATSVAAKSVSDVRLEYWNRYKVDFNFSFDSASEDSLREHIFWKNLISITRHNFNFRRGRTTFRLGINHFAHMTIEEIGKTFAPNETEYAKQLQSIRGVRFEPKVVAKNNYSDSELPDSFDWRNRGAVTKVKHQFFCGACYAMAVLAAVESHHFIATGKLISLSAQEIIDCGANFNTFGCGGGFDYRAIDYVKHRKGISAEADYPFTGRLGECQVARMQKVQINVVGSAVIVEEDREFVKRVLLERGPLIVPIDSDLDSFKRYSGGIFFDEKCNLAHLNHVVLLVGYGRENGKEFWILKNSYGEKWGEGGYMRIAMNRANDCGVSSQALFPVIKR